MYELVVVIRVSDFQQCGRHSKICYIVTTGFTALNEDRKQKGVINDDQPMKKVLEKNKIITTKCSFYVTWLLIYIRLISIAQYAKFNKMYLN